MRIRIEATDLPGAYCGPGPDYPDGHHNIHVAVQGRKGQQDLHGLTRGDALRASWDLDCSVVRPPPATDIRGPQIQGGPGQRFIYLTWGVVTDDEFRMFRRAKLWLKDVPEDVMAAGCASEHLVGRLGLTDDGGWPLCASVHPPLIRWSVA